MRKKIYQAVAHIAYTYKAEEEFQFRDEVAKQIEENQKSGWLSEVQYTSSASGGSIVFSALILAYTEE